MLFFFGLLFSLIFFFQADKSTIVDEAVNYIRSLQQTLQRLQKQKLEMIRGLTTINYDPSMITPHRLAMDSREAFLADQGSSSQLSSNPNPLGVARFPTSFRTWATPNMVLNVCGDKAHINICCPKKLGLFSAICYFLEKHKLEVVSAHVSSDNYRSLYMIQAQVSNLPSVCFQKKKKKFDCQQMSVFILFNRT